jgi:hypothetical protein
MKNKHFEHHSYESIPWQFLLKETVDFLRKDIGKSTFFFLLFLILSAADELSFFELNEKSNTELWSAVVALFLIMVFSYIVSAAFILSVAESTNQSPGWLPSVDWKKIRYLFFPVVILFVRGTFLVGFGLVILVVPGLYFFYKYTLASFLLILEGWRDDCYPLVRAEQIISSFKKSLPLLVAVAVFQWVGISLLEFCLKLTGIESGSVLKIAFITIQAGCTLVFYVFMTFAVLWMKDKVKKCSQ